MELETFQNVDLTNDLFLTQELVITLIPSFSPNLTSIKCYNQEQRLSALLVQRCQLMLWVAESLEKDAVKRPKHFMLYKGICSGKVFLGYRDV